jgi:hypothetical protein
MAGAYASDGWALQQTTHIEHLDTQVDKPLSTFGYSLVKRLEDGDPVCNVAAVHT